MTLAELTHRVGSAVGDSSGLNATVKFKFGLDGVIFIDGLATPIAVTNEDRDSMITLSVSKDNFENILDHKLKPQVALMTGKMRLKGDMRIALRLDSVFGTG